MQEKVVFDIKPFDGTRVKQKAMKVVCEFPGVTVIDVKEKGKLKVTGEFDKFQMTKNLKKICDSVDISSVVPDGKPVQNNNPVNKPVPKGTWQTSNSSRRPNQKKSDGCIIL